jgi:hypothetical protein
MVGLSLIGQAAPGPPTPPAAVPQLSTAEKEAITSLEKQKQGAYAVIQSTSQEEMQIAREFIVAHPGWHLNQRDFSVEKDPEHPVTPAPEKK